MYFEQSRAGHFRLQISSFGDGFLILVSQDAEGKAFGWCLDRDQGNELLSKAKICLDCSRQIFSDHFNDGEDYAQMVLQMARRGDILLTISGSDIHGEFEVELAIPVNDWQWLIDHLEDLYSPQFTISDVDLL